MSGDTNPAGAEPSFRYDALDGVRGFAGQVVCLGHLGGLACPDAPALVLTGLGWMSRIAVMTFFALSGFVIALSLRKLVRQEGRAFLLHYAVHRWARIFPPLAFAVATTFAVAVLARALGLALPGLRSPDFDVGVLAFLRGITLTFATSDATFALDGPLWSLRQEVWLYVIAAATAIVLTHRRIVALGAGALVLAMIAVTSGHFFYPQSLALFAAGAAVSTWGSDPRLQRVARSPWTGCVLVVLLAMPVAALPSGLEFASRMSNDPVFLAYQGALSVPIALALLGVATGSGAVSRVLARCKGAGSFSYTLYVVHNPVLVLAYAIAGALGIAQGGAPALLWAALALGLTEAFAYGAARVFERPRRFRELAWRGLALLGARREATRAAASPSRG